MDWPAQTRLEPLDHLEVLHLRVVEHLVDGVNRTRGHADLVEAGDPVRAGARARDLRDLAVERAAVFRAAIRGRIGGVLEELRRLQRLAEADPHVAAGSGDIDVT